MVQKTQDMGHVTVFPNPVGRRNGLVLVSCFKLFLRAIDTSCGTPVLCSRNLLKLGIEFITVFVIGFLLIVDEEIYTCRKEVGS